MRSGSDSREEKTCCIVLEASVKIQGFTLRCEVTVARFKWAHSGSFIEIGHRKTWA